VLGVTGPQVDAGIVVERRQLAGMRVDATTIIGRSGHSAEATGGDRCAPLSRPGFRVQVPPAERAIARRDRLPRWGARALLRSNTWHAAGRRLFPVLSGRLTTGKPRGQQSGRWNTLRPALP